MGKIKRKMKALHKKSSRKAKEKLKSADKGKLAYSKLGKPAQQMLQKRFKAGYKLPVKHASEAHKKPAEA